ncbi:MAG: tRNA preQ1(34) S-adenosylmethionine ribosyltransferase-isomerase QueA [Candidatus Omnitrophota bacterium]
MNLSNFDYNLPKELIAQYPVKDRDSSRLMVLNREDSTFTGAVFKNITDYLRLGDLLVLNNTKVLPARLIGSRLSGGKVDILLLGHKQGLTFNSEAPLNIDTPIDGIRFRFKALIKPGKIKLNEKIIFADKNIYARRSAKDEITFYAQSQEEIYNLGAMPLPPYIKRPPKESDKIDYQTVYAAVNGSVAAPTAGLHFTKELINKIEQKGVAIAYVTLHVGYATFKPVKAEDITQHVMDSECFHVPDETLRAIERAKSAKARVIAVGTTALRSIETYALGKKEGQTNLFIYPGYKFKIADCILTNFHLPRTTLFMLACAFGGEEFVKKAYQRAIEEKYRFYSYGDAMLIT